MNFILFCDKRQKRELETIIQKVDNVKLLGTEVVIRSDFLNKVFDEYNPHGVIIFSGVRMDCDFKEIDVVTAIKCQHPSMRIIYFYGEINEQEEFDEVYKKLTDNRIYDIITKQNFKEIFPLLIKEPFTKEMLDETLAEKEQTEIKPEQKKTDFNILYKLINLTAIQKFLIYMAVCLLIF